MQLIDLHQSKAKAPEEEQHLPGMWRNHCSRAIGFRFEAVALVAPLVDLKTSSERRGSAAAERTNTLPTPHASKASDWETK